MEDDKVLFPNGATQEVLAEFCSIARSIRYDLECNKLWDGVAYSKSIREVGEAFIGLVERYQISPQTWDSLYDLLHRSGHNR